MSFHSFYIYIYLDLVILQQRKEQDLLLKGITVIICWMYVLYCAALASFWMQPQPLLTHTHSLSLELKQCGHPQNSLTFNTATQTRKYANTYAETQRPGNLLVMRSAKSCSFPLGATIIEGWIWATVAHKWLGRSWYVLELNLNIMTRMMKLTQNHQLARAESDSGLAYIVWAYVWRFVLYGS